MPDLNWGENVVAVIQRRPGQDVTEAELIAFCKDHLASYKKPKQVVFVDELPRNAAGKILKRRAARPAPHRDRRMMTVRHCSTRRRG